MTLRQIAKENGAIYYQSFCKKCDTMTKHRVSNYSCMSCRDEYYQGNKEQIKETTKRYYQDNRKVILEKKKIRRTTPDHKKYHAEYIKLYREDPVHKSKNLLQRQVLHFIKRIGSKKEERTHELLGYSAKELYEHLESLFKDGMTWDNQGKWHIDHRIPQSYFTSIDQMRECFALSNLKPEWGKWNMSKGNRFIG